MPPCTAGPAARCRGSFLIPLKAIIGAGGSSPFPRLPFKAQLGAGSGSLAPAAAELWWVPCALHPRVVGAHLHQGLASPTQDGEALL